MQYLLLIYDVEKEMAKMSPQESQQFYGEYLRFTESIKASGNYLGGNPLQSVETATTVRVRNGKTAMVDGPFAETREQLGGYYLIEAQDLDAAAKIAAQIPSARAGSIEVRPIRAMSGPRNA